MTKARYEKVDLVANPSSTQVGTLEEVLIRGDLSKLTQEQRLEYVNRLCANHGLDPFTRPFDYLDLGGKLTLYINKGACDQLRKIHNISITKMEKIKEDDILYVTVYAQDKEGRSDFATGAISLLRTEPKYKWVDGVRHIDEDIGTPLKGNDLINVHLKAETKAKRRVTLSMGGLGSLSEDDIELIESDTSKPSTETLNKVHEESMKVVEEAQQTNKELYKIDDNFFSFNEVIFIMKNKINNISSPDDLSQYSDWIKLNRDGVKSFIDDHKNEYMELSELAQQKHNKYKVAK
jgi:hypothetical protein